MWTVVKTIGLRTFIGCVDGLIKGFKDVRCTQADIVQSVRCQLLELVWGQRRIGLMALEHRIKNIGYEAIEKDDDEWKDYFPKGKYHTFLRNYMQLIRRTLKEHKGPRDSYIAPDPVDIPSSLSSDRLISIIDFAKDYLSHTAHVEWTSPSTYSDNKITTDIMVAFWLGQNDFKALLAEHDVWNLRMRFGEIIGPVMESNMWIFLDGITEIDTENEDFDNFGSTDTQGYYGSSNRHLVGLEASELLKDQKKNILNITKSVKKFGTVDKGGMPEKLHRKFSSFIKVR